MSETTTSGRNLLNSAAKLLADRNAKAEEKKSNNLRIRLLVSLLMLLNQDKQLHVKMLDKIELEKLFLLVVNTHLSALKLNVRLERPLDSRESICKD